jgi:fimbrial chaperone protein
MKPLQGLLAGALALLTGAAIAQNSFTVTPLRIDLSPKSPAAVVEVINTSADSLTLQMQQRSWVQEDGRDAQAETRDLILSPTIFTLQPGERQVVRIALRGAPDTLRERAFRVFVSEVPSPLLRVAPDSSGFRVALRMDLPLFVAPLQPAQPAPEYTFEPATSRLVVRNSGTGHVRYTDAVVLQAGRKVAELPVFTVLPGGVRHFDLPKERVAPGSELRLQAESNAGPIEAAVATAR